MMFMMFMMFMSREGVSSLSIIIVSGLNIIDGGRERWRE